MVVVQGLVEWHLPQGLCHELCSKVAMCDTQDACVVSCSFYIILVVNMYQVSLFNFLYLLSDALVMLLASTLIGKACDTLYFIMAAGSACHWFAFEMATH
jgi:uncharacterized PurR-regulated membrane protein YhhQ (DUF165 family)